MNINVEGRRLTSPIQGFGKMWQKTYQVRIPADRVSPTDLIAAWKLHFPDFWPAGNHFYGPLTGIAPRGFTSTYPSARRRVSAVRRVVPGVAICSMRAARWVVWPTAV